MRSEIFRKLRREKLSKRGVESGEVRFTVGKRAKARQKRGARRALHTFSFFPGHRCILHIMAGPKKTPALEKKTTSVSTKMKQIEEASKHEANVDAGRKTRYGFLSAFMALWNV